MGRHLLEPIDAHHERASTGCQTAKMFQVSNHFLERDTGLDSSLSRKIDVIVLAVVRIAAATGAGVAKGIRRSVDLVEVDDSLLISVLDIGRDIAGVGFVKRHNVTASRRTDVVHNSS